MRMHGLHNPCFRSVLLDDLLHPAWCKGRVARRFKEIPILRIGLQMTAQHETEAFRKENVAVFASLAFGDENFAPLKINFLHRNAYQLARV